MALKIAKRAAPQIIEGPNAP